MNKIERKYVGIIGIVIGIRKKCPTKDRFEKIGSKEEISIIENHGGVNPYVMDGGITANDYILDTYYVKLEPEETVLVEDERH